MSWIVFSCLPDVIFIHILFWILWDETLSFVLFSSLMRPPPPLPADVLVGSLLGLALAWLCYRQHYPPLQDADCHRPLRRRETVPAAQERKLANCNYILPR